jgi:hypothetical protein
MIWTRGLEPFPHTLTWGSWIPQWRPCHIAALWFPRLSPPAALVLATHTQPVAQDFTLGHQLRPYFQTGGGGGQKRRWTIKLI